MSRLHGMDKAAERTAVARAPENLLEQAFSALAQGQVTALDTIWELVGARIHGLALWRTGSPEDAADVVQDVFVRIARKASSLHRVKNPEAWLMTVTRRLAVDCTRKRRVRSAEPLEACHYLAASGGGPDELADAARASEYLNRLQAVQREVIYLRLFAGCTFAEIGRIMSSTRFTAASRYRLGIGKLRTLLGEDR